ncbi:hypothetical protein, partial [Bacillus thuringiensis]|uniref:hypothetical protein n=1 Tax=Bacillus thuringiensis TaxID=1428 RepID=UPI00210024B8
FITLANWRVQIRTHYLVGESPIGRIGSTPVASLHAIPVAETVDNVRKQQELTEMSLERQFSPAGYQRRHGEKDNVETGEALDTR